MRIPRGGTRDAVARELSDDIKRKSPEAVATEATRWRRSCNLTSSGPASLRIRLHGCDRPMKCRPARSPGKTNGLPPIRGSSSSTGQRGWRQVEILPGLAVRQSSEAAAGIDPAPLQRQNLRHPCTAEHQQPNGRDGARVFGAARQDIAGRASSSADTSLSRGFSGKRLTCRQGLLWSGRSPTRSARFRMAESRSIARFAATGRSLAWHGAWRHDPVDFD